MSKRKNVVLFPLITVLVVFICTYLLVPTFYKNYSIKNYDTIVDSLVDTLMLDTNKESSCLRFAVENKAQVQLTNKNTNSKILTPELNTQNVTSKQASFKANNQTYELKIAFSNELSPAYKHTLTLSLLAGCLVLMVALYFYYISNKESHQSDFVDLEEKLDQLINANGNLELTAKNKSEKKVVSQINILAKKITDYQNQVQVLSNKPSAPATNWLDDENLKRIKRPIANACACISQAILSEKDFEKQKIALIEARLKLTQITENLIKSSPVKQDELLSVHELIKPQLDQYEVQLLEKRCGFKYNLGNDFKVTFNQESFYKLIESLMTFILNQCEMQSSIQVIQNNYDLVIAYQGARLTPESIEYVKTNDVNMKNVYSISTSLGLFIDFEENFGQNGMQFVLHF